MDLIALVLPDTHRFYFCDAVLSCISHHTTYPFYHIAINKVAATEEEEEVCSAAGAHTAVSASNLREVAPPLLAGSAHIIDMDGSVVPAKNALQWMGEDAPPELLPNCFILSAHRGWPRWPGSTGRGGGW